METVVISRLKMMIKMRNILHGIPAEFFFRPDPGVPSLHPRYYPLLRRKEEKTLARFNELY